MNKIEVYTPKENKKEKEIRIFLAGVIDQGNSYDWQKDIIERIKKWTKPHHNIIIYNPRYDNFGKSVALEDQIKWEQEHLDKADYIMMFLDSSSKAPVSLLELGLYSKTKKLSVFCHKNFYREKNVELTCLKYGIPFFEGQDRDTLLGQLEDRINFLTR